MNLKDLGREINLLVATYASEQAMAWLDRAEETARPPIPRPVPEHEEEKQPGPWQFLRGPGGVREANQSLPQKDWARWTETAWETAHLVEPIRHGRYFLRLLKDSDHPSVVAYYVTDQANIMTVAVVPYSEYDGDEQSAKAAALGMIDLDYADRQAQQEDEKPREPGLFETFWKLWMEKKID